MELLNIFLRGLCLFLFLPHRHCLAAPPSIVSGFLRRLTFSFGCAWKVRLGSMPVHRAISDSLELRSPSPPLLRRSVPVLTFSVTCADYACSDSSLVLDDDLSSTICAATVCTDDECCGDPGGQWVSCWWKFMSVSTCEGDWTVCLRALCLVVSLPPPLLMLSNGMASVACSVSAWSQEMGNPPAATPRSEKTRRA